jgi:hypothetical protein
VVNPGDAGKELFSCRGSLDATFKLAEGVAEKDASIMQFWTEEQVAAEARVAAHWAEVQRKQALAKQLRVQVTAVQSTLADKESQMRAAETERSNCPRYTYEHGYCETTAEYRAADKKVRACDASVQSARASLLAVQKQLADAEQAPTPVVQPLPSSRPLALQWLFFLLAQAPSTARAGCHLLLCKQCACTLYFKVFTIMQLSNMDLRMWHSPR